MVGWFQDLDVSGDVRPEGRPGLLEALVALREHGAGVLVVAKRDRLSREVETGALIRLMVREHGAVVRSADGVSDDDSPMGKAMQGMVDVFAELEKAMIVARTRAALAAKRRRGEMIGKPPYGQRVGPDGKRLEPAEDEQKVIRFAKEKRAAGASLRRVALDLYEAGFRARSGKPLDHKQVYNMLKDKS